MGKEERRGGRSSISEGCGGLERHNAHNCEIGARKDQGKGPGGRRNEDVFMEEKEKEEECVTRNEMPKKNSSR